jgi:hypothetical protein
MAKQDRKADLSALKAQEARTEQLIKKHESILDLYVKQGKSAEDINKKAKTLENAYTRIAKIQGKVLGIEQDISKEDSKQEKSLIRQATSAGSILAITEKMKSAIGYISTIQRNTANTMGVTLNKAAKLNKEIAKELKFGLETQTNREEILHTMHEMDDVFKQSNMYSANQAKDLAIVSNKLNISKTEAVKLTGAMQLVDGASSETATNTLVLAKNLADAKGVKFGAVMKEISKSGKDFANWSGMSMKNMIRTTIETRKMGFELSDAMNVANKLLDVEGSIESQMKFNVLTGKQANFDKARALMLEGKHAEALNEVRDQVGDISKLNILEIKSLEEATGLTREKLMVSTSLAENAANELNSAEGATEAYEEGNAQLAEQLASKEHATTAVEMMENAEKNIKDTLATQLSDQKKMKSVMMGIQIVQGAIAALSSVKAIAELTAMSAMTVGIGMIATLAAVSLGVAALTGAFSKAKPPAIQDGIIGSDGGLLVSGPKGSIQLDKDDSIIAGTDLGGGGGSSAVAQKLDVVIQLLSQQRVLNVSGTQLAEVMDLERIPVGMG